MMPVCDLQEPSELRRNGIFDQFDGASSRSRRLHQSRPASDQPTYSSSNAVAVTSEDEAFSAVTEGAQHIQIRNHLSMRAEFAEPIFVFGTLPNTTESIIVRDPSSVFASARLQGF